MRVLIVIVFVFAINAEAAWGWQPLHHAFGGTGRRCSASTRMRVSCNLFRFNNNNRDEALISSSSDSIDKNTTTTNTNDNKFGIAQRIDSVKSGIVGAVSASVGSALLLAIHDNSLQQWEFDVDGAAISGGLFAIVYRYCIRNDIDNPQLAQGVIGAFVITRTLGRFHVPTEACDALPLYCGPPLGYLNWDMILQLAWNGIESLAIFGLAAMAMDRVMKRGFISRFPG